MNSMKNVGNKLSAPCLNQYKIASVCAEYSILILRRLSKHKNAKYVLIAFLLPLGNYLKLPIYQFSLAS